MRDVRGDLSRLLRERFGIQHVTLDMDLADETALQTGHCDEAHGPSYPAAREGGMDRLGRALLVPQRRRILIALVTGSRRMDELAERLMTTPAEVAAHLACLEGCGLVRGGAAGYELTDERLAHALSDLLSFGLVVKHEGACPAPV